MDNPEVQLSQDSSAVLVQEQGTVNTFTSVMIHMYEM